jgi:hypothetical protein
MGASKRMLEAAEHERDVATEVAVEAGAIERCPNHEEVVISQFDDDANRHAYALATNRWKRGEVQCDREEFMETVKAVIDEASDECYICADLFSRD